MSDEIDRDAIEVLSINPKIWKEYRMKNWKEERETQWRGLPKERELPKMRELPKERLLPPARLVQGEFESITGPVDDHEAKKRHLESIRDRWFGYYKKSKEQKKSKLIDQYNFIAIMKQR